MNGRCLLGNIDDDDGFLFLFLPFFLSAMHAQLPEAKSTLTYLEPREGKLYSSTVGPAA